ncbi:MAG: ABC transporter ATP-binding protein [Desulfobacterales bacterium]
MIKQVLREFAANLPLMGRGLGLVWSAARAWTIAWGVLLLLQGLAPAALVYLTRIAVNRLSDASAASDVTGAFASAWPPIALIGILWIATQLLASLAAWVRTIQAELVQDHIKALIHRQALSLDMAFFDHPDSYDLLYLASVEAVHRPVTLLENLGNIMQNSLTLVILAAFLAAYGAWLPLLLIGGALPGLWAVGNFVLREHQWRVKNTVNGRLVNYYDWMLTERESAAEVRLFDLGPHFQGAFQRLRARLRFGRLALAREELITELKAGLIAWCGGLAGMAWMLFKATKGLVRLGDLVLCYQSFQQGQGLLRSLLESTGQIYRSTLFLNNLFQFLALKPRIADPPHPLPAPFPLRHGISFEGVTFSYPGSERKALADFSLFLAAGRMTAIVGQNGSGKSTLIKLLCRFYDPQEGKIMTDGTDLREMELAALRRQITVLFQEPLQYHTTAAENIALGFMAAASDGERIEAAARAAGVDSIIRRLPQDYETVLGKWFGGADLSVGEWQRLALARAFFRDASVIVLDEPTSAMDSWAEAEWLGRFRGLTAGRTTLIITHRFTTAMHADIIHVMDVGRVVESGTHNHLVAAGGSYAASWRAQMREAGTVTAVLIP